MGCDLSTLIKVLVKNGWVAPNCLPHAALAIATSIARLPFSLIERQAVARRQAALADQPPPIFIVGHWRSGTTFLYEILCRSPQFAYVSPFAVGLPWEFLTLGNLIRPLLERALPSDRFIDQMQVNPDSPQEDEIGLANMQLISFYHGLYFPSHLEANFNAGLFFDGCSEAEIERWQRVTRHFFAKVQLAQPGNQLLIKNPVYTARVALLQTLFPNARFVHIYRNPYIVFQSTRNFYWRLFAELALQPFDQVAVDELILASYPRMMKALLHDWPSLSEHHAIELQFEEFETDPVAHIQQIYHVLEIDGFDAAKPAFDAYLDVNKRYRKNRYQFPDAENERVYQHWQPWIDRWGYSPPTSGSN